MPGSERQGDLQVDLDNRPALDLYRAVGFRHAYRYAYLARERPA